MPQPKMIRGGGKFATAHTDGMGQRAEDLFQKVCTSNQLSLRPATRLENMRHFDFVVWPWSLSPLPYRSARVDVKSIKCPQRGARPDASLIFVELKDVRGNRGWVFGDADLIAFQQSERSFLVVHRAELADAAQRLAETAPMGKRSGQKGTLWTRQDREDLMICLDRDTHVRTLATAVDFELK
jgi:hypothetical protein